MIEYEIGLVCYGPEILSPESIIQDTNKINKYFKIKEGKDSLTITIRKDRRFNLFCLKMECYKYFIHIKNVDKPYKVRGCRGEIYHIIPIDRPSTTVFYNSIRRITANEEITFGPNVILHNDFGFAIVPDEQFKDDPFFMELYKSLNYYLNGDNIHYDDWVVKRNHKIVKEWKDYCYEHSVKTRLYKWAKKNIPSVVGYLSLLLNEGTTIDKCIHVFLLVSLLWHVGVVIVMLLYASINGLSLF